MVVLASPRRQREEAYQKLEVVQVYIISNCRLTFLYIKKKIKNMVWECSLAKVFAKCICIRPKAQLLTLEKKW